MARVNDKGERQGRMTREYTLVRSGSPNDGKAMLKSAGVVDEPFLHGVIPLVSEALPFVSHRWGAADLRLPLAESIALKFEAPLPVRVFRLNKKAVPVKLRGPLLARIVRLPATFDGLESMPTGLVSSADAGPIGLRQAFRHLIG